MQMFNKKIIVDDSFEFENSNDIISALIEKKKIKDISKFLNPDIKNLYDISNIYDIDKAISIVLSSIKDNKKILIYGDYDVDGTTSIAVLYRFLKDNFNNHENVYYEVANRFVGGYGFSKFAAEKCIKDSVDLIITVDCGVSDFNSIHIVKDAGIKVIVLDHHEVNKSKEHPADVVIDFKKDDLQYPFRELSACGVVFKFISAISIKLNKNISEVYKYLDFVCLSTACDIVPLVDENRIIMYHGLKKINSYPSLCLKKMIDLYNISSVSMHDILFKLGPSINSSGRLSSADLSVKFLLEDDEYTAEILAKELIKTNNERKRLCNKIVEEIKSLCDYDKKYTFLFNENWHLGVLGIVASKCIDIKYCPTIIMTKVDENTIVGSARSVKDVDIYSLFERCKDDLINFGGHKMAVGFKLQRNKIEEFRQHFEEEVERSVSIDNLTPTINVDFKIDLKKITKDLFYTLQQFEPFGIGNENPIFASEIVCKRYSIEYNNIVINFVENNIKYYGIGYNLNDKEDILRSGKKFLLIYSYKNIVDDDIILNVHYIVDGY